MGRALVIASRDNQIIDMCRLITQGADVNYVLIFMREGKEMTTTPLIQAALKGHAGAARVLISRGAEVNKLEPCEGFTALHVSAEGGHVPVIELLMSSGARTDVRNKYGQTPLHQASIHGHNEAATICLLDRGADINAKDNKGFSALLAASQEGLLPVVHLLVLRGADLNLANNQGDTPLITASQNGHLPVVELLVLRGADLNLANNKGFTPQTVAAHQGHLPIVDLLVLRGADLNLANNQGAAPLIMAAQDGYLEVVKLLVEKEALVDQPANDGGTALAQASLQGHPEVVDFLLSAGAHINHLNADGMSPLYGAAQGGHLPVVKLLVRGGADINQATLQGLNPLHMTAFKGLKEVVDYLMSKGAKLEAIGAARVTACKCCGATGVSLKKCSGCQTVYYCSPECQKKDWKEGDENRHKIQCARLAEVMLQYEEKVKKEIEEKMAEFGM